MQNLFNKKMLKIYSFLHNLSLEESMMIKLGLKRVFML